ncbi:cyclin [Pycnococcus provasolii]
MTTTTTLSHQTETPTTNEPTDTRLARWACSLKLEHAVSCVGLAAAMLTRYHLATEDKSTTPSTSSSSPEPRTPCSGGTAVDASSSSSCSPSSSSSPATSRANSPISPQPRKRSRSARAKARMAHLSDSVVAACLWLASKVEEVQCEVPSARDISESTGVEVKTLVSAELQVSVTLKWDLLKHWHNTTTQ